MKKFITPLAHHALIHPGMVWKHEVPHLPEAMVATMIWGIGFAPILALALSLVGIFTLPFASLILVVPALAIAIGLVCYHPGYGRLMLQGYVMGIIAVTCYDCVRIPFTMAGWMDDFIPKIGGMLVGDSHQQAIVGYLWRYLGNGGGMGMAFVGAFALLRGRFLVLRFLGEQKSALLFGIFVWACLIMTLKISPQGEEIMFVMTPISLLLSLIGHLVFGFTLGFLANRFPWGGLHLPESCSSACSQK
jgi:hypothetical protein